MVVRGYQNTCSLMYINAYEIDQVSERLMPTRPDLKIILLLIHL